MSTPAAAAAGHGKYRPDVDGLRAVAVLAVVAFHVQPSLLPGGFVGVDVFFVISGFLITGILLERLQRDAFSLGDFYARRIRRIFPALSILLAATLIAGWFVLLPSEYADLGGNVAAGAGFGSNILLWQQTSYFGPAVNSKPLLHLWSLGIEEQYYLFWPLMLAALWRWQRRLVPIALLFAVSFIANVVLSARNPTAAFYAPWSRIWELLIGSTIAYVTLQFDHPVALAAKAIAVDAAQRARLESRLANAAAVIGVAMIGVAMVMLTGRSMFPGYWALLPTVGTGLVICAGSSSLINRTVLSLRPVVLIGLISYPLYLFHWPVLALIRIQFPDASNVIKGLAMVGVFVAAYLTYRIAETPIRRRGGAKSVAWLCIAQAVLLGVGLFVFWKNGVPDRGSEEQRQVFALDQRAVRRVAVRAEGSCFLENKGPEAFAPACVQALPADSAKPRVLLWGDSFAGHLASGILQLTGDSIAFNHMTSAGCPPMLGFNDARRPFCHATNEFVFDWIRRNRPTTVFVAARWNGYPRFAAIDSTLRALAALRLPHVVLVGPAAQYPERVPRLLLRGLAKQGIRERLPSEMLPRLRVVDSTLREAANRAGLAFASPLGVQCTDAGCLVAIDRSGSTFMIWDDGHLTAIGSRFVADSVLRRYIGR